MFNLDEEEEEAEENESERIASGNWHKKLVEQIGKC